MIIIIIIKWIIGKNKIYNDLILIQKGYIYIN